MSERAYLPLRDVAAACGISEVQLQTRYFPPGFAVPRDWRFVPRSSSGLVAEQSLPQLADELEKAGQAEAGAKLRAWLTEMETPAEPLEEFIARHSAPRREAKAWFKEGQYE